MKFGAIALAALLPVTATATEAAVGRILKSSTAPDNVSSRLMVHIPHSLFQEEGYDHREALFGMPPYGGSIAQNVYYADQDMCDVNVDATKGYPKHDDPKTGKPGPWPSPYILMVDRGNCTFVHKVRNAQRSGAAGVVIADHICLCNDLDCKPAHDDQCETQEPIMADDGSGGDISIPSFLMFKRDADKVKDELMSNRPVQIEMAWSLPTPDDRVEYDLWTTPGDKISKSFFENFGIVAEALGKRAYFTPHMYVYDGIKSHCQGNGGENFCTGLCTNKGKYCATDPDNDLQSGVSGADIVRESLRRLCIWSAYGATDGLGSKWWEYVKQFNQRCNKEGESKYFKDPACIKDALNKAKIDRKKVDQCMADSGGTEEDKANSYFEAEIAIQKSRGVVVIPTAFVNAAAIRGALTVTNIFQAICSGYSSGTAPSICDKCSGCHDTAACVKKGRCAKNGGGGASGGVSTGFFMFSMLIVVGGFGSLAVWHYKKTQDDMRDQVRGILAEYMPLEDHEGNGMMKGSPMDFAQGGQTASLIG